MDLLTPARKWALIEKEEVRAEMAAERRAAAEQKHDGHPHHEHEHHGMPLPQQLAMLATIVVPILGLLLAIILLWHNGPMSVGWPQIISMLGMYAVAGFGITVGYHRLLTHKSFETPRAVRLFFAICGSTACQGAAIRWCATHRRHHQAADHEGDPHSPHLHGDSVLGLLRGMWHAHMGWLFDRDVPDTARSVPDLVNDPTMLTIDRQYHLWVLVGIIIPGIFVGLWTGTWQGALSGMIWGGLVRICLMQHVTWSINSICHVWGGRPFKTTDQSANNWVCAVLALGEGWHNNHHAFPTSARQGLRWWQFDSSWIVIRTITLLGLAKNVRVPSQEAMRLRSKKIAEASRPHSRASLLIPSPGTPGEG